MYFAKRQLYTVIFAFSNKKFDQLLEVDEKKRLGNENQNSVRSHPWFDGVDWKGIRDGTFPVPDTITSRVAQFLASYPEDCSDSLAKPPQDPEEQDTPEWINDW